MAKQFGFDHVYTDFRAMLDKEKPDGCVAVTPVPITAEVAVAVMRMGVPLLMEKPPGATLEEARRVCAVAEETGARVMVSLNRRFHPAIRAMLTWLGERPLAYVRAAFIRHRRGEPRFYVDTVVHAIDTLRLIAGEVENFTVTARTMEQARWAVSQFSFVSGALATLEVFPDSGHLVEAYELFGQGYHVRATVRGAGAGETTAWEGDRLAWRKRLTDDAPRFVVNGTYDETAAFIASIKGERPFGPTPGEVLRSVEISHEIAAIVDPEDSVGTGAAKCCKVPTALRR
jgi:predicted dehydrogenase